MGGNASSTPYQRGVPVETRDLQTETSEAELNSFFASDPATIAWPYPMYDRWREGNGVVQWESGPATVITRYRDVKAVMSGVYPTGQDAHRHGSLAQGTLSRLPVEMHEIFYDIFDFESLFVSRMDGDAHLRLRRIAARAFTARRVEALRGRIQAHVDELIDTMLLTPTCDVKTQLSNQLPVRVITDMLGVPQSDREMIWNWSEVIAAGYSVDRTTLQRAKEAIDAFREYVGAMIARLRATGEGPELAMLLLQSTDDDAMTEQELVAMYLLILFAGGATTTNLLGNGFLALQRNRDQWDMVCADPSLARGAVDEVLRYDSPHHYLPRVAAADIEIAGTKIPEGRTIIIVQGAANHDTDVFEDPKTMDILRANKSDHLSLAFGPHYCLGAALARIEGELVISTLTKRFPDAHLLTDEFSYGGSAMLRSVNNLPTDLGTEAKVAG
jgi:cytochrome P450